MQKSDKYEGIEVTDAMLQGQHALNRTLKDHMAKNLKPQYENIAQEQFREINEFKSQFLAECEKADQAVKKAIEFIESRHHVLSGKSCLKSPLSKYLKHMSRFDMEGLVKVIDNDVAICTQNVEKMQDTFEKVNQNYAKFIADQQK